jgi:hypothetical protein
MLITQGEIGQKSLWKCDECGKEFLLTNHRAKFLTRKGYNSYCSKKCKSKHWRLFAAKRLREWTNKNGQPRLKKGYGLTTDGYIWIRVIGRYHNQVKLHRYLMEIKLGRKLLANEIIHHIDGDKLNNNIDNLEIIDGFKHGKIHDIFRRRLLVEKDKKFKKKQTPHNTISEATKK